jgi:hypothetical protein
MVTVAVTLEGLGQGTRDGLQEGPRVALIWICERVRDGDTE